MENVTPYNIYILSKHMIADPNHYFYSHLVFKHFVSKKKLLNQNQLFAISVRSCQSKCLLQLSDLCKMYKTGPCMESYEIWAFYGSHKSCVMNCFPTLSADDADRAL